MSFFVAVVGLGLLIFVHELGHFTASLALRMRPRRFYVGFPPAIWKTKRKGIEYGIGAIPLGGFVKIPGMHRPAPSDVETQFARVVADAPELAGPLARLRDALAAGEMEDARGQLPALQAAIESKKLTPQGAEAAQKALAELDDALGPDAYWRAATWKRIVVIFAGPAANILLAIVLLTGLFLAVGGKATTTVEARRVRLGRRAGRAASRRPRGRDRRTAARAGGDLEDDHVLQGAPARGHRPAQRHLVRLKPVSARQLEDGNYRLGFVLRGEGLSPVAAAGEALRVHRAGDEGDRRIADTARLGLGSRRDLQPGRHRAGLLRGGETGRRLLHLGACADLALARTDQSAAAAARSTAATSRSRSSRASAAGRSGARSTSASRWSASRSSCCSSSSASRTTSGGCRSSRERLTPRERSPLHWVAGGQRGADQGRQRRDRRRRARRRAVDDADEDARRRGDDRADRRARLGGLRDRARRGAEERGRRGAADDRPPLAAAGDRRHPLQRLAGAEGDRRRRRRRADQPRQHRRPGEGRAGRRAPPSAPGSRCGSAPTPARCPRTCTSSRSEDQAEALVAAALEEVELLERLDYRDFKISVKATHVPTMIRAYRMLAAKVPYPLHLGVTEAGTPFAGLDQERGRDGRAARGRHRRHAARLAHRRPGQGGRGRLGDPQGARAARAGAGDDRVPVVRPRQRRRREARRASSRSGCATTRRRSRWPSWAAP